MDPARVWRGLPWALWPRWNRDESELERGLLGEGLPGEWRTGVRRAERGVGLSPSLPVNAMSQRAPQHPGGKSWRCIHAAAQVAQRSSVERVCVSKQLVRDHVI